MEFLSQPRSIGEIAEHFKISQSEAQRSVLEAAESGMVLITSSKRQPKSGSVVTIIEERARKTPGFSPRLRTLPDPLKKQERLNLRPGLRRPSSRLKLGGYRRLRFKFQQGQPSPVRRSPTRHSTSELLGLRPRSHGAIKRAPLWLQIRILEEVSEKPWPAVDLQRTFGISHIVLDQLVRRGMLTSTWGSKGAGAVFKITARGLKEAQLLGTVSKAGSELRTKPLISSRTIRTQ